MLEKSSTSYLGAWGRRFESCHPDQGGCFGYETPALDCQKSPLDFFDKFYSLLRAYFVPRRGTKSTLAAYVFSARYTPRRKIILTLFAA